MAVPIAQTVWEASPRDIRSPEPPGEEPTGVDFVLLDMTGKTNSDLVTQVSDWLEAQIFSLVEVAEVHATDHLHWTASDMQPFSQLVQHSWYNTAAPYERIWCSCVPTHASCHQLECQCTMA